MRKYGIGEWFGRLFTSLTVTERKDLAIIAQKSFKSANQPCPFKRISGNPTICNKKGGVCSFRLYEREGSKTHAVHGDAGTLVTMCPQRFLEDDLVYGWIGETLLGSTATRILNEFNFLVVRDSEEDNENNEETKSVGRIDTVLVFESDEHLEWCPVEMQSVYFSGKGMPAEFKMLVDNEERLPLLAENRRPDWRSSGPKRLMPQLQIKVPTLRRWGKKLALVVDAAFYEAFGETPQANDVSNADIVWFVVDYEVSSVAAKLKRSKLGRTTLERSIETLVGGEPITKSIFERQIREKLAALERGKGECRSRLG